MFVYAKYLRPRLVASHKNLPRVTVIFLVLLVRLSDSWTGYGSMPTISIQNKSNTILASSVRFFFCKLTSVKSISKRYYRLVRIDKLFIFTLP